MKLDQAGIDFLHEREGYRSKPYLDTKGIPTIGYGNTYYPDGRKVTMQDKPLTPALAEQLFHAMVDPLEKQINALIKTKLTQNQYNAIVSFTYNVGIGALSNSTALKKINANPNDPTIREALMRFNKPPEIIGRRKMEADLYFS